MILSDDDVEVKSKIFSFDFTFCSNDSDSQDVLCVRVCGG